MPGHERHLHELAASVSDGSPVDWDQEELAAQDPEHLALVRALRGLSAIASAHRAWQQTSPPRRPAKTGGKESAGRWGHLEIHEKVGSGTFGEVYRARDTQLDRVVALKLLRLDTPSAAHTAEWIDEARLLARVRHPNVATVYGADQRRGRVGFWMEFVEGRTLSELLHEQGAFGSHEAALIGLDLCRAMAAVHSQGMLHRDLKAQNVMREKGGRIVLMDFGIGRNFLRAGEVDRGLSGTPVYMAPEVIAGGTATVQSDIYSLGVLLFHLVTGKFPFTGSSVSELRQAHARGQTRLLRDVRPDLSESFVRVAEGALAKSPAERPASAGALEAQLKVALDDGAAYGIDAPQPRPLLKLRAIGGRRIASLALLLTAVVFLALWFSFGMPPRAKPAINWYREAMSWYDGEGGFLDEARALMLVERAAGQGDELAKMWVARSLYGGRMGYPREEERGRELARNVAAAVERRANGGDSLAAWLWGEALKDGIGVQPDQEAAAKWLKTACDRGALLVACANLGILYSRGTGVERDPAHAALLYGFACDRGDLVACQLQGAVYDHGFGVVQDRARAERLYDRACKGRLFRACVKQGTLLVTGDGARVDREKAMDLFRRACDSGEATGCTSLITMAQTGATP